VTGPQRVRVEGDLFHPRVPDGATYVGRPGPSLKGSRYANPFKPGGQAVNPATGREVTVVDRVHAVALYEAMLAQQEAKNPEWARRARLELAGRALACWCDLADSCHVDVLLRFVNQPHFDTCGHLKDEANIRVQVVTAKGKVYRYERCRACTTRAEQQRRFVRRRAERASS
jgi:hypothetical protein